MFENIESYLKALKLCLKGADPALIQDALWDAESHLRSSLASYKDAHKESSESEALKAVIIAYGTPEEVAEAYLERDAVVQSALRAPAPLLDTETQNSSVSAQATLGPWPGLFQVLWTPKVYTSLLYLIMALPMGIFFFTWAVTGISLSAGLMILVVGLPFAIAFIGSIRILALAEGRLVEALLDVRMPRRPSLLPEGKNWPQKLKSLLTDAHTWTSLAYMIVSLPLGIFYFTTFVTLLSVAFAFIGVPVAYWIFGAPVTVGWFNAEVAAPEWLIALTPILGFVLLLGTLHLALLLGRLQGFLAKHLLVQR